MHNAWDTLSIHRLKTHFVYQMQLYVMLKLSQQVAPRPHSDSLRSQNKTDSYKGKFAPKFNIEMHNLKLIIGSFNRFSPKVKFIFKNTLKEV